MAFVSGLWCGIRGRRRKSLGTVSCTQNVEGENERPNIKRSTVQQSVISTRKDSLRPEEMNELLEKNGKPPRSVYRISKALHFSSLIVTARLTTQDRLIALARATSDGALNGTILDILIDPDLPDKDALKLAVTKRMLLELRRLVPECSVALLAPEEDVPFYRNLAFAADQNGVRLMALQEENWDITI